MTCSINDSHWLEFVGGPITTTRRQVKWSPKIEPRVIVIHYGVTHSQAGLIAAQRSRNYWAHLSIDGGHKDGADTSYYQVHQAIPFNVRGSHAGASEYQGERGVNGFSIGIEIANPGPIIDGKTVYKKAWPEDQTEAHDVPEGFPRSWTHWASYTDQEIDILVEVCGALVEKYPSIEAIVGHSDISPGRKFDPGPAFPMAYLNEVIFGQSEDLSQADVFDLTEGLD